MIRPLRDRHRWLVPLVAILVLLVLAWAFTGRERAPSAALPPAHPGAVP